MTCGSCPFTDGLCYTSLPPQVRCNITNEFHYYSDECNCIERMQSQKEELDFVKKKLSEPGTLMAINYDGPMAPAVSFTNDDVTVAAAAEASSDLLEKYAADTTDNKNKISAKPVSNTIELDAIDKRFLEPVCMYVTHCLVCDTEVPVYFLGGGPKVCPDCKRTIKFIKERFKTEIESFE